MSLVPWSLGCDGELNGWLVSDALQDGRSKTLARDNRRKCRQGSRPGELANLPQEARGECIVRTAVRKLDWTFLTGAQSERIAS